MATEELACQDLVELVTDYLEGALSERDRKRFEAHLRNCDGCTEYLDEMRATIRVAGTLAPEAISKAMRDRLLRSFRDWKTASTV